MIKENERKSANLKLQIQRFFLVNKKWVVFSLLALLSVYTIIYFVNAEFKQHDERLVQLKQKLSLIDSKEKELDEKYERNKQLEEQLAQKKQDLGNQEREIEQREQQLKAALAQAGKSDEIIIESKISVSSQRQAVKEAMVFAWNGYVSKCWGSDELLPVSGGCDNGMGLGLTIIDALDTLWIMDLKDEFNKGREWIRTSLNLRQNRFTSLFETNIRVLGGLLSAYELSKDKIFLSKAEELGNLFLPAFKTPSGIPMSSINLASGAATSFSWMGGASPLAEVGTLQLEFFYLSKHTNNSIFAQTALKIFDLLDKQPKRYPGLYSVYISTQDGGFSRDHITLGALGDSFYEYLIKLWLLSDKQLVQYKRMYDESVNGIKAHLLKKSSPNNLMYIAELIGGQISAKMDHLVCFIAAIFSLEPSNLEMAKGIGKTCYETYRRTATGIGPELVRFESNDDFYVPGDAKHYLLRPETSEAIFYLWRQTKDPIYRDWGWKIFQAIEKYCKAKFGYSGIRDVTTTNIMFDDKQQSFFLAETLKYLYLIFADDDLIPLDKYVFNTEAHPLGIINDISNIQLDNAKARQG